MVARNGLECLQKLEIDEVLRYIKDAFASKNGLGRKKNFYGSNINLTAPHLKCFLVHGTSCYICGDKGAYFSIDKQVSGDKTIHLNLWGINKYGDEVMFNADHIYPSSLGGSSKEFNLRTTCTRCNRKKGNTASVNNMIDYIINHNINIIKDFLIAHNFDISYVNSFNEEFIELNEQMKKSIINAFLVGALNKNKSA